MMALGNCGDRITNGLIVSFLYIIVNNPIYKKRQQIFDLLS